MDFDIQNCVSAEVLAESLTDNSNRIPELFVEIASIVKPGTVYYDDFFDGLGDVDKWSGELQREDMKRILKFFAAINAFCKDVHGVSADD